MLLAGCRTVLPWHVGAINAKTAGVGARFIAPAGRMNATPTIRDAWLLGVPATRSWDLLILYPLLRQYSLFEWMLYFFYFGD
jgi:hypothetical protein